MEDVRKMRGWGMPFAASKRQELRLNQLIKKDSCEGLLLAEYEEYRELTGQKKEAEEKAAEKKEAENTVDDLIRSLKESK